MSKEIILIARFDLKEGELEELKSLYSMGIDDIKQKEPGVIYFSLYVAPDEKTFCSLEAYEDSKTILDHFAISSNRIPKILQISTVKSVEIYGAVSKEVHDLLDPYGTVYYDYSVGYSKYD